MRIFRFLPGHLPVLAGVEEISTSKQASEFFWLDIERSETDWHNKSYAWLKTPLHDRHLQDTLNDTHPPYYDGTDDYDLLVVRALCPDCPPEAPNTRPIAFILTDNAVISIRFPGDPVFSKLHKRFLDAQRNSPTSVAMLLYLLLDQITNTLLAPRDNISELLSRWQERLLDRNDVFNDWQALMRLRGQLRRLEVVSENQLDTIVEWREQTGLVVDSALAVRFNDLQEHLRRVYNHALVVQQDIDALVQVYFSSNTQRTNEILQFLTILSAVFLPLNLLAGLFGMNFTHLPLLQLWYGPWLLLGVMLIIVIGLLVWFRRKRWI
ncbi:MAG: magnesium transporter CorA family protein [Chromatiales bacterium]|jgi:magnesium/cobalt transport protein CorA